MSTVFGVPELSAFGVSWATIEAAFGTVGAQRYYFTPSQNVPASSPSPPHSNTVMIVSIKPTPANVISGSLDSALATLFSTVRPGDMWTYYHEAEAHISLSDWQNAATHMYPIFKANAPASAMFGEIHMSYTAYTGSSHYPLSQWILGGTNTSQAMDFIGIDMYPSVDTVTWANTINPVVTQVTSIISNPVWAICESNVGATTGLGLGTDAQMIAWNNAAYTWCVNNSSLTYVSYWGNAPLTWPPTTAVTANLVTVNSELSGPSISEVVSATAHIPAPTITVKTVPTAVLATAALPSIFFITPSAQGVAVIPVPTIQFNTPVAGTAVNAVANLPTPAVVAASTTIAPQALSCAASIQAAAGGISLVLNI